MRLIRTWPAALLWLTVPYADGRSLLREECPIVINRESYKVSGSSLAELRESMLERGPRDKRGIPRFANTEWNVDWRWQRNGDGSVKIDTLAVVCSASILMPQLDTSAISNRKTAATEEFNSRWHRFLARLERHELNHLKHVQYRAPLISARLKAAHQKHGALSPARANAIAAEVVREIHQLDRQYDSETLHGKSEGVWEVG